jgi:hypothetical protein
MSSPAEENLNIRDRQRKEAALRFSKKCIDF